MDQLLGEEANRRLAGAMPLLTRKLHSLQNFPTVSKLGEIKVFRGETDSDSEQGRIRC